MTHRPVRACQARGAGSALGNLLHGRAVEASPPSPPARPPRHVPMSGKKVYGALAAIAFGIVAISASCCVLWLYYVELRGQR